MLVFNESYLETWRQNGYRFILVLPRDKYGVLRPLVDDKPLKRGYTIELDELRLLQMTDEYFLTMEKDVVPKHQTSH